MDFRFSKRTLHARIVHRLFHKRLPPTMGRANTARFISLALFLPVLFEGSGAAASQPTEWYPRLIEVFTTTDSKVIGTPSLVTSPDRSEIKLQRHELDGIQRFEAQLSNNLPADPKQSKQIALQRIQQLDEQESAVIQNTAVGLAKAMQYDVDRYPAIVFNGQVVVYGVTDLKVALGHYRIWREGARP